MTTPFIVNHLWQSSCFALLAGLLAFLLRKNSPKVRYWVWVSASLKFLMPFALLVSLGSVVPRPAPRAASVPAPAFANTLVQIAAPFSATPKDTVPTYSPLHWFPVAIGVVWACGFFAITLARCRSWLGVQASLRAGTPIELPIPVPAFITPGVEEPGIVGFVRPVLVRLNQQDHRSRIWDEDRSNPCPSFGTSDTPRPLTAISTALAQPLVVFGPETFVRGSGEEVDIGPTGSLPRVSEAEITRLQQNPQGYQWYTHRIPLGGVAG